MTTKTVEINGQLVTVKICPSSKVIASLSLTKKRVKRVYCKGALHCARELGQFVEKSPEGKKKEVRND